MHRKADYTSVFSNPDEVLSYFNGRSALLATMHGKEQAIAPVLAEGLGLQVEVPKGFNTDVFGTFAGDVERPAPQVETAAFKAAACLGHFPDADLVLASEGAFYGHPESPFLTVNTEIVLLRERHSGLQVAGISSRTGTMAASSDVSTVEALREFASNMDFPRHGLILKAGEAAEMTVRKDFTDLPSLESAFSEMIATYPSITVETDLRAHRNPMRMEHIAKAAQDLVRRLLALCPQCGHPDFVVKDFERGLPCELCRIPTRLPLKDILHCKHCGHRDAILYPKGETAYAGHCDWCNP